MSGIGFFELLILIVIFFLFLGPRGAVNAVIALLLAIANSQPKRKSPKKDEEN